MPLNRLLVLLPFLLCACTTTVQQVEKNPAVMASLESQSEPDPEQKLENLPVSTMVDKGWRYLGEGNLQLAQVHFSAALQKNDEEVSAIVGLGEILRRNGKIEQAAKVFAKALEIDPEHAKALLAMARLERSQGNPDAAVDLLEKALENHPDNTAVLSELGKSLDAMGQSKKAEPFYRRVVELRSNSSSAHNGLGLNLLLQERYGEAIDRFSRALQLAPNSKRIKNNLGMAYALAGNEKVALGLFESSQGKAAAYNNLGYLYLTQSRWEEAEDALKRAIELRPRFYVKAQKNLERLRQLRTSARR